jgi:hypothetical protein
VRFQEGRAWIVGCPKARCQVPVIEAHVYGVKLYLSRWSVPYRHAVILQRYERIVINIRNGVGALYAENWSYTFGRPDDGRLYARHVCGISGKGPHGRTH